LQNTLDFALKR